MTNAGWSAPRNEALLLAGVGAFLIFVEGVVEIVTGVALTEFSSAAVVAAALAGLVSLVLALAIAWFCFLYYVTPFHGGAYGAAIIVVGSVSLWVGGGFVVGFVLAVIGGLLAVLLPPAWEPNPSYSPASEKTPDGRTRTPATGVARSVPVMSEQAVVRYCPKCWAKNAAGEPRCRSCGSDLPHPNPGIPPTTP